MVFLQQKQYPPEAKYIYISVIYPKFSAVVPQKSCLSVQISLEKMEDPVEYSKVANTISSWVAFWDVRFYSETLKQASHLLLALKSNGEKP